MATTNKNRTTLVNGCGTILKTNRLKGGYKLVKRKNVAGASTSAKTKAVIKTTEKVVLTAPVKGKVGRPKKEKVIVTTTTTATAPVKGKVGRPTKAKVVTTATATIKTKAKATSKGKGKNEYFDKMNKARKEGASSFEYKGKTYVASKTKTGIVVYKAKGTATTTTTAPAKSRGGKKTTATTKTMKSSVKAPAKKKKRRTTAKV